MAIQSGRSRSEILKLHPIGRNPVVQASGSPAIFTFMRSNGDVATYQGDGAGTFYSPTAENLSTLSLDKVASPNVWKETTPDGTQTVYPADLTGAVTSVSYVQDSVGNRHTFAYSAGQMESLEDAVGRRVSFAYNGGVLETIQDWAGCITSFAYDSASIRGKPALTTVTGPSGCQTVYDAANQLQTEALGAVITTYGYDANGNRSTVAVGAGITSYTWDEENRLTGIAYPDATIATYVYSADGLRQRKVDTGGTVNYLWDESRILQETDVSLVEQVRYTHGTDGWQTLVAQNRGGVDSFFGYDLVGNTRLLVDLAGNTTDTTVYESFGMERARTGTTISNYQFGGQVGYQRDEAARLYVRARHRARLLAQPRSNWV